MAGVLMLPHVHLLIDSDGTGVVEVDGQPLAGVRTVMLNAAAGQVPTVTVTFNARKVTAELPANVHAVTDPAGSATEFVRSLNPVTLQAAVEQYGDMDTSMGEALAGVLEPLAQRYDCD